MAVGARLGGLSPVAITIACPTCGGATSGWVALPDDGTVNYGAVTLQPCGDVVFLDALVESAELAVRAATVVFYRAIGRS